MGIALRMSKMQVLVLVLLILSLIAISLVVLYGIVPGLWHTLFSAKIAGMPHHYLGR